MFERKNRSLFLTVVAMVAIAGSSLANAQSRKKVCLHIEGNTGAGKTTLLALLQKNIPGVDVFNEPIERWQDVGGNGNLFALYFEDAPRWALTFQLYATLTEVQQMCQAQESEQCIAITDRSVYCAHNCFLDINYRLHALTALEYTIAKKIVADLIKKHSMHSDGFIYLKTEPKTCAARVQKRNRSEEATCSLQFLELLHEYYEKWFIDRVELLPVISDVPVLILDGELNFAMDEAIQKEYIARVASFIEKIQG